MKIVGTDAAEVERALVGGGLACPECGGRLRPWGSALGHRRAGAAKVPVSTVRGWFRRFAANAEAIRVWFTVLAHDLDPMLAPLVATALEEHRNEKSR